MIRLETREATKIDPLLYIRILDGIGIKPKKEGDCKGRPTGFDWFESSTGEFGIILEYDGCVERYVYPSLSALPYDVYRVVETVMRDVYKWVSSLDEDKIRSAFEMAIVTDEERMEAARELASFVADVILRYRDVRFLPGGRGVVRSSLVEQGWRLSDLYVVETRGVVKIYSPNGLEYILEPSIDPFIEDGRAWVTLMEAYMHLLRRYGLPVRVDARRAEILATAVNLDLSSLTVRDGRCELATYIVEALKAMYTLRNTAIPEAPVIVSNDGVEARGEDEAEAMVTRYMVEHGIPRIYPTDSTIALDFIDTTIELEIRGAEDEVKLDREDVKTAIIDALLSGTRYTVSEQKP